MNASDIKDDIERGTARPYKCEECGTELSASEAVNYVGPMAGDGFRRTAIVCQTCFEVLP